MIKKETQQGEQLLAVAAGAGGGVQVGAGEQLLAEYSTTDHCDHCRDGGRAAEVGSEVPHLDH